jgi:hypothetical protein
MTFAWILIGTLCILWMVARAKKTVEHSVKAQIQVAYVNLFLADDTIKDWIKSCNTSKEVIETGKDKLWESARSLRNKMNTLRKSDWKIEQGDHSILDNMIEVNKIILAMEMAQHNDLSFDEPQMVAIEEEDDNDDGGDGGLAV